jgi:hypothetical protein
MGLPAAALLALLWAWPAAAAGGAAPDRTRVELTDLRTGRRIASRVLAPGERAVLRWTNSLFRLGVTEVFVARGGGLELDGVTFEDPEGREPPRVRPEDVADLYHTGGPFRAEGLSRPVKRVIFRVGAIGDPSLRLGDRTIRFAAEVGFGGAIALEASPEPSAPARPTPSPTRSRGAPPSSASP